MDKNVGKGCRGVSDVRRSRERVEQLSNATVDCFGFVIVVRCPVGLEKLFPCVNGRVIRLVVNDQQRSIGDVSPTGGGFRRIRYMVAYPPQQLFEYGLILLNYE